MWDNPIQRVPPQYLIGILTSVGIIGEEFQRLINTFRKFSLREASGERSDGGDEAFHFKGRVVTDRNDLHRVTLDRGETRAGV